jgi:hypothetical protein
VDDIHVNGKLTLGEDVADLGGLILAYRGWLAETANKTVERREKGTSGLVGPESGIRKRTNGQTDNGQTNNRQAVIFQRPA